MQSEVHGWAVWDRSRLFEARTDEVGLLGSANQQGGDRWMLVAHVSGPLRLQPELYAQTAWGGIVVLVRKPGVGWLVCDHTDPLVTCAAYGTQRIRRKHHWSKASRCCLDASVTLHDTVGFYAWMWWEVTKPCGAASLSHLAANALRWLNHFFYSV